jgi:hypothetical protein
MGLALLAGALLAHPVLADEPPPAPSASAAAPGSAPPRIRFRAHAGAGAGFSTFASPRMGEDRR